MDGLIKESTILNCASIIGGYTYSEPGAGTYVGEYINADAGQPTPNEVYYVHVVVYGIGNSCSGQYAYIDIGLPAHTSLAISTAYPVYCYGYGGQITTECPQTLPASTYNTGMYNIIDSYKPYVWPVPQGQSIEFQIPVISTTTLSGSNFEAAVWMLDGNDSPWLYPTEGIYVFAPPTPSAPGAFNKTSPANGATGQPTSLTLSWGASSGATSYQYCLSSTTCTAASTWTSTGTARSKALSGLTRGARYYWEVRAKNSGGTTYANGGSSWSFKVVISAPTNVQASDGTYTTKVLVSWNASSGASSYKVYRASSASGTKSLRGSPTSTSFNDTSATPGVTYYYWVQACRVACSGNSAYNTGWRKLSPPTNVKASDGTYTTKVLVSWSASSGATSYKVYRATSASGTKSLRGSPTSATFNDTSATPGVTYYYWVVAYRGSRYSGYSASNTGWRKK
jgi:hypothetical protein